MTTDASTPKRDEVAREPAGRRSSQFAFILSIVRDFAAAEQVMREVEAAAGHPFAVARERISALGLEVALSPEAIQGIERVAQAEPAAPWLEAVKACLEGIGGKARSVLGMRYRDGMGGAEIARRTKSTATEVHRTLSRARTSLALCVEGRLKARRESP